VSKLAVASTNEVIVDLTEESPITVLHVDDELGLLKVTKQCLEMEGRFRVDAASSVEQAMEKLGEEAYDVVVSDYQMPGKDGLDFLKELRQKGNNIPFILFTGKGREEVAIKALNLGADQYLNKVGDPETVYGELAHSISRAVERKRAQRRIEESEERYKNLFELAPDGILTLNFDGVITSCNTTVTTMSGYSKGEIVGKRFSELSFIPSEDIPAYVDAFASVAKGESPKPLEATWTRKDGTLCISEFRIGFIRENGKTVGVQAIARDITERKIMEEALRESEERFRAISSSAKDGVIVLDSEGRISFWNPATKNIFGYAKEEVIGKELVSFLVPQRFQTGMSNALGKFAEAGEGQFVGKTVEIIANKKDGTEVIAELSLSAFQMKGKWHAVGILRDITKRKRAEKERKLFEESLSALNVYGRDLNMAKSMGEIYELVLNVAEKTLGFEFADVLLVEGKTLRAVAHRGYIEKLSLELSLDGDKGITVRAARTGKPVLVPDIGNDSAYVGVGLHMCSELAVPIKIGPRVIGVLNVESVKLDAFDEEDEELLEILASHAATAMSNLDRARKLDAVNEKLRVVGGLTRHDVRNKLSTITGNAYLLKRRLAGNGKAIGKLEEMEKAIQQAVKIFEFAKTYEMLGAEELAYIDVEKTVEEAVSLFAGQNTVRVINDCHGLTVWADSLLRELFYNLTDNSLKHGQKAARIRVYYEKPSQDSLKLVYEDDGIGIPLIEKPKLFTEGYSTGGSTGHGLYLIKRMIEVYGWAIQETGTPGKGAQFTITIPKTNNHGKENYQIA
jgi:PAS domain S-box-containing protein